ncbi:MAG TPA: hypothetical protein VKE69_15375, partial [Planctomycetota bacterium]|nr:hypothetical protein [Planctomycetota bacterium]
MTRVGRWLLVLIVALAALATADHVLARAEGDARSTSSRVRRLLEPDLRKDEIVGEIRIDDVAKGASTIVTREGELWRCGTYHQAVANDQTIKSLLGKVHNTEGFLERGHDVATATAAMERSPLRLVLTRTKEAGGATLGSFDVGAATADAKGCYARPTGSREVWSLDANLREECETHGALPPLVDSSVVPGAWPGWTKGMQKMRIERGGAPAYELEGR